VAIVKTFLAFASLINAGMTHAVRSLIAVIGRHAFTARSTTTFVVRPDRCCRNRTGIEVRLVERGIQ
jgi:hypothetical protein